MMSPEHGTTEDLICIFMHNNVPAEVSNILVHELCAYETLHDFIYSKELELNLLHMPYFKESKLPGEGLCSQWPLAVTNCLIYLHRWLLNYIAKYRRCPDIRELSPKQFTILPSEIPDLEEENIREAQGSYGFKTPSVGLPTTMATIPEESTKPKRESTFNYYLYA